MKYGRDLLYCKYVMYPKKAQSEVHCKKHEQAGMHRAVSSMNTCYVLIEKCSHWLKQNHLGEKLKLTYFSYNLLIVMEDRLFTPHFIILQDRTINSSLI